jgi:hypothetical protein
MYAWKSTHTHAALTVSSQSIMSGKLTAACALVWLAASVDLGVPLEIVLTDEAIETDRTLKLAIVEMGLDVRLDVFFAAELLVAVFKSAGVLVAGIRTSHVGVDGRL